MNQSVIAQLDWQTLELSSLQSPQANEVLVVITQLTSNGRSTLSDSERAQAIDLLSDIQWDRFERRSGATKEAYLSGRYYLLKLLAQLTNVEPEAIRLSYSRLNKPYLAPNPSDLHFNFTDTQIVESGSKVFFGVFVFCTAAEVGIDIEGTQRNVNASAIAARRFSTPELEYFNETESKERFLQLWTRKEAFGKAAGVGINFRMNQLNLLPDRTSRATFVSHDHVWSLQQFAGPAGQIACLVHAGDSAKKISAYQIEPSN